MPEIEIRELESSDFEDEEFIQPLLDMDMVEVDLTELRDIFEKRKSTTNTYLALVDGKIAGVASLAIWYRHICSKSFAPDCWPSGKGLDTVLRAARL